MALEVNKRHVKILCDNSFCPRRFSEGELVLLWDQLKEPMGAGKFNPMWHGPYIVKRVLEKGTYELWIMREQPWRSLEMGSISKNTMRNSQLGLILCILLYNFIFWFWFPCGD